MLRHRVVERHNAPRLGLIGASRGGRGLAFGPLGIQARVLEGHGVLGQPEWIASRITAAAAERTEALIAVVDEEDAESGGVLGLIKSAAGNVRRTSP